MKGSSAPFDSEDPRLATVNRFGEACAGEPAVAAAFLGGSFARGTADDYSDLDLYAITEDDDYEAFFSRRYAFVERWLEAVLLETSVNFEGFGFDMVHFVGADGVSGELALAHRSNFGVMHGGPHRTLVDKAGLLEGVSFTGAPPDPDAVRARVDHALKWFWLHQIGLTKSLARGRLLDAARGLGHMREACATLLMSASRPPRSGEREALAASYVNASAAELKEGAHVLMDLHRRLGEELASKLGLEYPTEAGKVAIAKLAGVGSIVL